MNGRRRNWYKVFCPWRDIHCGIRVGLSNELFILNPSEKFVVLALICLLPMEALRPPFVGMKWVQWWWGQRQSVSKKLPPREGKFRYGLPFEVVPYTKDFMCFKEWGFKDFECDIDMTNTKQIFTRSPSTEGDRVNGAGRKLLNTTMQLVCFQL